MTLDRYAPYSEAVQIQVAGVQLEVCINPSIKAKLIGLAGNQKPDNETKQTKDRAEDLDDENLDEEGGISSVSERSTTAVDADSNTADEIAHADR